MKSFTGSFVTNWLAVVTVSGWHVDTEVIALDVNEVVPPPAPLAARTVTGDVKVELRDAVLGPDAEMAFGLKAWFLALVKGLEEVDGLGEVVVPHKVDDVLDV